MNSSLSARVSLTRKWKITTAASVAIAALVIPAAAVTPASAIAAAIDTSNFADVLTAYQERYLPANDVQTEWSGSGNCTVGENTENTRQAGIDATNYFRAMAGLAPVGEYAAGSVYTDATVTLIEAQGNGINYVNLAGNPHQPVETLNCWTQTAFDGANSSSLAFASAPGVFNSPADAVQGWIDDEGNDTTLGHRRWLLNPAETSVGLSFGPTSAALGSFSPAALTGGSASELAWPNAGYIPFEILPTHSNQWSYSMPGADFSTATVTVTQENEDITVTPQPLENPGPPNYPNALSWVMPENATLAPEQNTIVDYEITIAGITGGSSSSVNYHVLVFAADSWTAEAPLDPPTDLSPEALVVYNMIQALPETVHNWDVADDVAAASRAYNELADQSEISGDALAKLEGLQLLAGEVNRIDSAHGARVMGAVVPWYVRLHAIESDDYSMLDEVRGDATSIALYDIFFTDTLAGSAWEFPIDEQVMISLTQAGFGLAGDYQVVHLPAAGGVEYPVASRDGDTVSFIASSFSPYAILFTKQQSPSDNTDGLAHTGVAAPWLPIGAGAALLLAGLAVGISRRSHRA